MNRRKEAPRIIDQPRPGCYQIRLVPKGPWVGARIVHHDDGRWQAFINGDPEDEGHADPVRARGVTHVGNYGVEITEDDYFVLIGKVAHAMRHVPDAPEAHPTEAIDLNRLVSLY